MFGNCFFKMFCDSLIKLSSSWPLLRLVLRSFSRTWTLTDLVSFVEVFLSLLRHQITKASLPKCSCLGVTVPNDYRSLVLSCQMMFSAQYCLRFGDCRDPLVTPCWWYKDLTTPAPVCLLFLPRSVSFSATQCRPPWILVAGALHPTTSFAALVLCQCSLLPQPSPGLEFTSWHELSHLIGGCISDFVREWVSTARLWPDFRLDE